MALRRVDTVTAGARSIPTPRGSPPDDADQPSSSSKNPGWSSSPELASPCGRSNDLTWALRTKRLFPTLMLCSWPTRAHRPIVPDVNLMFEEASSALASESEIQSAGGFDIAQSGSCDGAGAAAGAGAGAESDEGAGSVAVVSPELDPDSLAAVWLALPAPARSLRAQPVPL